jgi:UDP-N-acetylmuramoyl-L-alanyl-D-glutamate--2,6-diaminopimelate ligase
VIPIADILARLQSCGLLAESVPRIGLTVTGVSDDSREVRAGDLYCAIRGYVHDGHRFLSDAAEAGAVAALVETPETGVDLPQIKVADSRRAAAIAAQVVFGDPAVGLRLVGVTGTNGKTTTVHLARHILSRRYSCGSLGTLGVIAASGEREQTQLTTPGPIEFARRLAKLKKDGVEYVVAEISSHALSQGRVDGVTFDIGVFTNLSRDHLDYHADLEEYRATKSRLAELVDADGALVVNADDPAWSALPKRGRLIRYGLRAEGDYMAHDIDLGPAGSHWTLVTPERPVPATLPLPGEFNVSNALAAAATAGAFGFEPQEIADALATVPPVPGRLEILSDRPLVVRDYAHTPDALRRALAALRPLARGRLIVVFGCGGDRDPGKRPLMGRAAAEGADYAIVTSDNPRSEPPEAIIAEILPGLGDAAYEDNVDRRAAIARALEMAEPDDAVLLAGKGHEDYQVIGAERRAFDEALIVKELLSERRRKP